MKSNLSTIVKGKGRDLLSTAMMIPDRLGNIKSASAEQAFDPEKFTVNQVAAAIHPAALSLKITKVTEHTPDIKSFFFTWEGSQPLAYFRAGQYLSVVVPIGAAVVTRAYSLSSSPAEALKGIYSITVKRVQGGFVSNYILDNWAEGTRVSAYAPEGWFTYEPLRDAPTVIGVAGGSGITPFLSMAKAIDEGSEDFCLTLLYGARNRKDLVFKAEFDAIAKRNPDKFRVVYVLSDEKVRGYSNGFIGAKLIKKHAPAEGKYSIFACGPAAMYDFLNSEIPSLGIARKYVRMESFGIKNDATGEKGIIEGDYKITVINRGETTVIPAKGAETVLVALERAGITVPVRCRSGECGFCRSKVLEGNVYIPGSADYRRISDARYGYIHPCCCYPVTDLTLKIN